MVGLERLGQATPETCPGIRQQPKRWRPQTDQPMPLDHGLDLRRRERPIARERPKIEIVRRHIE
jgi:hypothetical protein